MESQEHRKEGWFEDEDINLRKKVTKVRALTIESINANFTKT